jgi:hypothetical protein
MEAELRELLDKQAIAELLYAYGEGIDRRDSELLEGGRYLDRLSKHDGRWRFAERTIVFDWSKITPAEGTHWWDAPGDPAKVGAHRPADPAWRFLDPRTAW